MKLQLYKVIWFDCSVSAGWKTVDEIKEDALEGYNTPCETVGWLLHETPKYIILVSSWDGDISYAQYSCILKPCIIKREKL